MKILEMTATFGTLNKATLRPGAGFTLIQAPNEYGKSTWAAFLRAMLYGFPPRDRDKEGYIAEKNRYQPWSGAAMEGTLTVEWRGRQVTLYRGPKGAVPWGAFSAVWTASGDPVEGLTAETCGEALTGVSREVFERTLFVGQGEVPLSPSADLEKRVHALATTGEEEVSYSQVERRLKDWLNRRRVNAKVGLIPQLEGELAQVEEVLARQGTLLRQSQAAQQEKEALEGQKAALEAQLAAHAAARASQQQQRRAQAQADYAAAQERADALARRVKDLPPADRLRQAQGDLSYLNTLTANLRMADKAVPPAREKAEAAQKQVEDDPCFAGMDPAQAAGRAQRDSDQVLRLEKNAPTLLSLLGIPVGAVLVLLLSWAKEGRLSAEPPAIALGALIGWAVIALPLFLRQASRRKKAAALRAQYGAADPDDILKLSADYAQRCAAAQAAQQELQSVEKERDRLYDQQSELTVSLLDLVHTFEPGVTDLFGISAAISRALQLEESCALAQNDLRAAERLLSALPSPEAAPAAPLPAVPPQGDPTALAAQLGAVNGELARASDQAARLQGELRSLGDPAVSQARRTALTEELARRWEEHEAISAALESLKNADAILRERFSPAVNQKAGEYLAALTAGRYHKAALTRQFQALAQEEGSAAPHPALALSGGTAQQLYLAVRLAMCELALPQDDPCPILLDDVLDSFDDRRAKLALDCLLELSQRRQVLLFTCHSRERAMLDHAPVTVLGPM